MTEQEIVNVLKENKSKGIAYMFLPEAVRDWVSEHFSEPKLLHLNPMGNFEEFDVWSVDDYDNIVFALSDDYKIKQEPKGEWVEFEITEGKFSFIPSDVNGLDDVIESWWNWQEFLTVSSKYNLGFTAFGGWQYPNKKRWFMSPHVYYSNTDSYWLSYDDDDNCKPAIPVKIRFWKGGIK